MGKNGVLSLNADILLMRVLKYSEYVKRGLPDIVLSSELDKIMHCLSLPARDIKGTKIKLIDDSMVDRYAKEQEDLISETNGDMTYFEGSINSSLLGRLDQLLIFKKIKDEEEMLLKLNEAKGIPDINKARWAKIEKIVREELEEEGFFE